LTSDRTMRAAAFLGDRRIELRELPVPKPGAGEVLLKVSACGVCGTDNHILNGEITDGVFPPVVLGHEIAATVAEPGLGTDAFEPGLFCAVDPVVGCGVCRKCRAGHDNLCNATSIIGYKRNGGFAQYVVVPAGKVIPMSDRFGAPGAVLCETLACVVNGYDRLDFTAGSSALILGAGTVGLLWTQMLASSPTSVLIQTEPHAFRRDKAAELGADVVIDPAGGNVASLVRRELPEGVDYIIDATGNPRAVSEALPLLSRSGTFMIFGVCPAGSTVSFDPFVIYNKQARIVASKMPVGTLDRAADLIASGRIACDDIVTTTVPLDSLADAVAGFSDHRDTQIKVAVDPWL
jgi:L-iditol 2-dehydrogenase